MPCGWRLRTRTADTNPESRGRDPARGQYPHSARRVDHNTSSTLIAEPQSIAETEGDVSSCHTESAEFRAPIPILLEQPLSPPLSPDPLFRLR